MVLLARTVRHAAAVMLLVLAACTALLAFLAHAPLGGRRISVLTVTSGSMTPVFHAGDAVGVRTADDTARAALRAGNVIAFRDAATGQTVTHRISAVIGHTDGHVEYVTKGDANAAEDATAVDPEQVIGTLAFHVPFGGHVLRVIRDPRIPALLFGALLAGAASIASAGRRRQESSPA